MSEVSGERTASVGFDGAKDAPMTAGAPFVKPGRASLARTRQVPEGHGAPPEVLAIVVAAVGLMREADTPTGAPADARPSVWRFSGRWWAPPAALRRERPGLLASARGGPAAW